MKDFLLLVYNVTNMFYGIGIFITAISFRKEIMALPFWKKIGVLLIILGFTVPYTIGIVLEFFPHW